MAKKLPLIISTLTLLTSSAISTATWADGFEHPIEGPWNFEQMMAAEAEVQPIIDEVCPYEYNVTSCVQRYTYDRYNDDPIYNRLLSFENNQFHVLSLDPNPKNGKNTIEYYFTAENTFEKDSKKVKTETNNMGGIVRKYFDSSMYTYKIYELYFYQVELGNNPAPVNGNYEEVFSAPYTKMLYSSVKSDSEDSLLPAYQKGTLEIGEISYDSIYSNKLYVAFKDEKGKMHTHSVIFSNCHQGGELCKMQYTKSGAYPEIVNKPTYEEGYKDGYNDGSATGFDEGYAAGLAEGYENGHADGKNEGYAAGYADGEESGYTGGYDDGYSDGRHDGLDEGFNEGYERGHMHGLDEGWMEGYDNGLNDGFTEGQDIGYHEGYDNGYNNGYNNGYTIGYNAALQSQDENNGNTGDDTSDNTGDNTSDDSSASSDDSQNGNTDNTNQATSSEISVQNTNMISLSSGSLESNSKLQLRAKTPNTGASTAQEGNASEFPWWLGAIFAFGAMTLIWLFVPKTKKSHKKS